MTPDVYIKAKQVKARFLVSDMWISRHLKDPVLPLPPPMYVGGHRFWRVADLETWEAARKAADHTPRPGPRS
jgi:predicted DNA-binding transcriptional regulator AlpA